MSGGHFDYEQYRIERVADEIKKIIDDRDWYQYSEETRERLRDAHDACRVAAMLVQRVDWLVSDDDSEESFHRRLVEDSEMVNKILLKNSLL